MANDLNRLEDSIGQKLLAMIDALNREHVKAASVAHESYAAAGLPKDIPSGMFDLAWAIDTAIGDVKWILTTHLNGHALRHSLPRLPENSHAKRAEVLAELIKISDEADSGPEMHSLDGAK